MFQSITERGYKPLGGKAYGSIPHLPGSRVGPDDHKCPAGQTRIATEKARDRHDRVIAQVKFDGSCCSVLRRDGLLLPLVRSGYLATSSPFEQHWHFHNWVMAHQSRFLDVLEEEERLCGEWLMQAHGTRYTICREPFMAFDLICQGQRMTVPGFNERVKGLFWVPPVVNPDYKPVGIERALQELDALDTIDHPLGKGERHEGVVWRVERNELLHPGKGPERAWKVDFLIKYVRPDKEDGRYLPEISGEKPVWNWRPGFGGY